MVRLEKFERSDFDQLISWIDSEESMIQFSGTIFKYPIDCEQLEKYISADNRLVYKVIDIETNNVIGHAELNNINHQHKNARICRILVGETSERNKGYGKAIIKELVRFGFEELKLHRLDLGVYNFNKQAIKCYQDCGFEIEGLMRENTMVGNEYWSSFNMSILNPNRS